MFARKLTEEEQSRINPGILKTVNMLRAWGFETTDSGDGATRDFECDHSQPYVFMKVRPDLLAYESDMLFQRLKIIGVEFNNPPHPQDDPDGWEKYPNIQASYSPIDGVAAIVLFNVML